jgi:hypothetical protein
MEIEAGSDVSDVNVYIVFLCCVTSTQYMSSLHWLFSLTSNTQTGY